MVRTSPSEITRWQPLPVETVRHLLGQVYGAQNFPPELLARTARLFQAPAPGALHFAAQRRQLGAVLLLLMTMSALRMRGATSAEPPEDVHICFVLSGAVTLTPHRDPATRLGPGGACAVSDWGQFDAECSAGTRSLHVVMPQSALITRGVHITPARFRLDGSRSLRSPLRGFALSVADTSWRASSTGALVAERTLEDLVVGMFLEVDGYAMDSEDLRAGLRARALSEIAASHRSNEVNPRSVAERLSVSLRHLQRAFESGEESIAQAITRQRTESAAFLLSSPGAATLTIDEVAHDAGFSSTFELRAAFRARYAMLPSQFRDCQPAMQSRATAGPVLRPRSL
jgi:AraC-like DNA-binding protein